MAEVMISLDAVNQRLDFHKRRVMELTLDKKNTNSEQLEIHKYQLRRFKKARLTAVTAGQVDISKFDGNED